MYVSLKDQDDFKQRKMHGLTTVSQSFPVFLMPWTTSTNEHSLLFSSQRHSVQILHIFQVFYKIYAEKKMETEDEKFGFFEEKERLTLSNVNNL